MISKDYFNLKRTCHEIFNAFFGLEISGSLMSRLKPILHLFREMLDSKI